MAGIVELPDESSEIRSLRVVVLDVGHGNCAVVQDDNEVAVIDAPKTRVLPDFLAAHGKTTVNKLVLSHADADHIGGAQALLGDDEIAVEELWINPNPMQHSQTYLDLLTMAKYRYNSGELRVKTGLNVGVDGDLSFGRIGIEVLHPDILHAGIGPTHSSHPLGAITNNGMSAVIRISLLGHPAVLLPGDMDAKAFESLLESDAEISAPVLVFPHHGGSAKGRSDRDFSAKLCSAVRPELVIFSIGRRRFSNPSPEIVAGVRSVSSSVHIACTQLSRNCHEGDLDAGSFAHIAKDLPSAGLKMRTSCAGSISIEWEEGNIQYRPVRNDHFGFVQRSVSSPMCIGSFNSGS